MRVTDEDGVRTLSGVMLDVTARRASEARLRLLLDNMQDTIFRVRLAPELAVEYVSPSCEALTGYTPAEWHANPSLPLDVVHPDDRDVVAGALQGCPAPDGPHALAPPRRHDGVGRDDAPRRVRRRRPPRGAGGRGARRHRARPGHRGRPPLARAVRGHVHAGPGRDGPDLGGPRGPPTSSSRSTPRCASCSAARARSCSRARSTTSPTPTTAGARWTSSAGCWPTRSPPSWSRSATSAATDRSSGAPCAGRSCATPTAARCTPWATSRTSRAGSVHEEELRRRALHDGLTELPNRQLFMDRLERALAQRPDGRLVGVLFADLDELKAINDTHGHPAGDGVIRELSRRFREAVRPGDSVARLAGDEFTVLCPAVPDAGALLELGRRLLAALEPDVLIDGEAIDVTVSIGAAVGVPGAHRRRAARRGRRRVAARQARGQGRASRSSTRVSGPRSATAAPARRRSATRPTMASSSCTTSRSPGCAPRASPPSRRSCAGGTRPRGCSRPRCSSTWPSASASSTASAAGCSTAPAATAWSGRATAARRRPLLVNVSPREIASERLVGDVADALAAPAATGARCASRSPRAGSSRTRSPRWPTSAALRSSGSGSPSTTSGPATRRSAHLRSFPSTSSRSTARSSPGSATAGRATGRWSRPCLDGLGARHAARRRGDRDRGAARLLLEFGCDVGQGYLLGRPAAGGRARRMAARGRRALPSRARRRRGVASGWTRGRRTTSSASRRRPAP